MFVCFRATGGAARDVGQGGEAGLVSRRLARGFLGSEFALAALREHFLDWGWVLAVLREHVSGSEFIVTALREHFLDWGLDSRRPARKCLEAKRSLLIGGCRTL